MLWGWEVRASQQVFSLWTWGMDCLFTKLVLWILRSAYGVTIIFFCSKIHWLVLQSVVSTLSNTWCHWIGRVSLGTGFYLGESWEPWEKFSHSPRGGISHELMASICTGFPVVIPIQATGEEGEVRWVLYSVQSDIACDMAELMLSPGHTHR